MRSTEDGMTLVELIAASLIAGLIAGGAMSAFVTATKLSRVTAPNTVEAAYLAQQTLDRFRNKVACDDSDWFKSDCTPNTIDQTADPIPTGSKLSGATRTYAMTPADCDGDGTDGDCLKVDVKVTWTPPQ